MSTKMSFGTTTTTYDECPSGLSCVGSSIIAEEGTTAPKVSACRRAGTMLPGPLVHSDASKTRALTTIYAPRKQKPRKHKTAQTRMLESNIPVKPSLSPFHPLPAIGQRPEETKTKVIVFDLNNTKENQGLKLREVLKPLTPRSIHGYARKSSLDRLERRPQQLLRENTYEVIEPLFVNAEKIKKADILNTPGAENKMKTNGVKVSPKTRFKNAAMQVAKLSSMPETGKLLCLRERQTFTVCREDNSSCRLQKLPQSPAQKLTKLSEIFQNLDMTGRHRDKMKKENSWF